MKKKRSDKCQEFTSSSWGERGSLRSVRELSDRHIKILWDEPMENVLHKIYICFERLSQKISLVLLFHVSFYALGCFLYKNWLTLFYRIYSKRKLYISYCEIFVLLYVNTNMRWSSLFHLKWFLGTCWYSSKFLDFGNRHLISNLSSATCKFLILEQVT